VLTIVPAASGLLAGTAAIALLDAAFQVVGAAAGVAIGYMSYVAALHQFPCGVEILSHDLTFWLCTVGAAVLGGSLLRRIEFTLFVVATSALGGALLVPALAILVLSRIDSRFLWILNPESRSEHASSPFIYGQAIGGVVATILGVQFQSTPARRVHAERTEFFVQARKPLLVQP